MTFIKWYDGGHNMFTSDGKAGRLCVRTNVRLGSDANLLCRFWHVSGKFRKVFQQIIINKKMAENKRNEMYHPHL